MEKKTQTQPKHKNHYKIHSKYSHFLTSTSILPLKILKLNFSRLPVL